MSDRRLLTVLIGIVGLWVVLVIVGVLVWAPRLRHALQAPARAAAGPPPLLLPEVPAGPVDPAKGCYPGKPLPAGTPNQASRQSGSAELSYYRKRGLLAYQRYGRHRPAWHPLATGFLERVARRQACVTPLPAFDGLLATARQLRKRGCDDPVVLAQAGLLLIEAEDWQAATSSLEQAVAAFSHSTYPPYCRVGACYNLARRKWHYLPAEQAANQSLREQMIAALAPAARADVFAPPEQRVFWNNVLAPALERELKGSEAGLVNALQAQSGCDPWLLLMARGKQALAEGWRVRGEGWATQVSPQAWPVFERGLQQARRCWEQAYNLHPDWPEAATNLITVAYASDENPRVWFDRAVAAQFDYAPAYRLMIEGLLPRWGGSHRDLLAFGKECLDTKRFDTAVPMVFQDIVETLDKREGMTSIWQSPSVWESLRNAHSGRLAYLAAHRPDLVKAQGSAFVLLAWRTRHYDEARRQADALGGELDPSVFRGRLSERPEVIVAGLHAADDRQRQALLEAEKHFQQSPGAQDLAAFQTLLKAARDPHVQRYLQDRLQTLHWEQAFYRGDWVALLPTENLVGWKMLKGTCKPLPDGQGFELYPGDEAALLDCHVRPSFRFELTCEVQFPAGKTSHLGAGVLSELRAWPEESYEACVVRCEPPQVVCWVAGGEQRSFALPALPQRCALRLLKDNDSYTLSVNGKTVLKEQHLGTNGTYADATVGFGAPAWADHSKPVTYRNLRLRRLQ